MKMEWKEEPVDMVPLEDCPSTKKKKRGDKFVTLTCKEGSGHVTPHRNGKTTWKN